MSGQARGRDPAAAPTFAALLLRPLTSTDAAEVAAWRYPPPFDVYDGDDDPDGLPGPDDDGLGYYALSTAAGELVGFCCLGPEGRVPGQHHDPGTLDIGMGLRPDLLSAGLGSAALPAVLALACGTGTPRRLRTVVAAFNERSLRLCRAAGFTELRRFDGPGDRLFVELDRPA